MKKEEEKEEEEGDGTVVVEFGKEEREKEREREGGGRVFVAETERGRGSVLEGVVRRTKGETKDDNKAGHNRFHLLRLQRAKLQLFPATSLFFRTYLTLRPA